MGECMCLCILVKIIFLLLITLTFMCERSFLLYLYFSLIAIYLHAYKYILDGSKLDQEFSRMFQCISLRYKTNFNHFNICSIKG